MVFQNLKRAYKNRIPHRVRNVYCNKKHVCLSQNNANKYYINTDACFMTNFQLVLESATVWEIA